MKINNISINKPINLYENKEHKYNNKKTYIQKDKIELSEVGKKLSLYEVIDFKNRGKKVEEIKRAFENGTYSVDSESIAKKMFNVIKSRDI